ncbi:hypothetical protein ACFE04_031553 [Oxalis oulophora]
MQAEAHEAIIHDVSNLCDVVEAMCDAQEERVKKLYIDLPVWSSPQELMATLCEDILYRKQFLVLLPPNCYKLTQNIHGNNQNEYHHSSSSSSSGGPTSSPTPSSSVSTSTPNSNNLARGKLSNIDCEVVIELLEVRNRKVNCRSENLQVERLQILMMNGGGMNQAGKVICIARRCFSSNIPTKPPNTTSLFTQQTSLDQFLHINCKSGNVTVKDAFYYFDQMIHVQPGGASFSITKFNSLFIGLARCKHYKEAISLFKRLISTGEYVQQPNFITYSALLNCFCHLRRTRDGFAALGLLIRRGYHPNTVHFTCLVKLLCAQRRNDDAFRLFRKMGIFGCRPNDVTYGTLIHGFCQTGDFDVALKLLDEIDDDRNCQFTAVTNCKLVSYTSIIDHLCKDGFIDKAKQLFLEMKAKGIEANVVTYATLLRALYSTNRCEDANELFIQMLDHGVRPNVYILNALVEFLCGKGKLDEVNELLELMNRIGVKPSRVTYSIMMNHYCLLGRIDEAKEVFRAMVSNGYEPDCYCYTILINGYCNNQKTDEAVSLLEEMTRKGIKPTVVTYNTLISSFFGAEQVSEAQKLLGDMRKKYDIVPHTSTYCIIMDGLCKNGYFSVAISLLHSLENCMSSKLDISVYTPLIDGLFKIGKLKDAWLLFNRLSDRGPVPNVITYSIMIRELCKEGNLEKANDMLFEMEKKGCVPNVIIFNTLMHKFYENNEMQRVIDLLNKMAARNLSPNDFTISIVANMLSKPDNYREYFEKIPQFPVRKAITEYIKKSEGRQPKKRTFKKFSFKGVDLDNLLDMSSDELVKLYIAHARRR